MSRPATSRLKVNPPLGNMPALQYLLPAQLKVDPAYQRSLDGGPSQSLIRKIAMFWNWDLCQPLVVARRDNGDLFVIDGQHRLAAANLRGDISQLPAVVVSYADPKDEAASFVHLNQQRRPLTKIDVFKAAVASGDEEANAIANALDDAGLSIAPHSNHTAWKPGMVSNIGGIEEAWRRRGPSATKLALRALGEGFEGQVLRYAGTIFPGIASVCAKQLSLGGFGGNGWKQFLAMLGAKKQTAWRGLMMQARAHNPDLKYSAASEKVIETAWGQAKTSIPAAPAMPAPPEPKPARPASPSAIRRPAMPAPSDGKRWCDQCDKRISLAAAATCTDRFCKLRPSMRR